LYIFVWKVHMEMYNRTLSFSFIFYMVALLGVAKI
jgi:hypothetical protein